MYVLFFDYSFLKSLFNLKARDRNNIEKLCQLLKVNFFPVYLHSNIKLEESRYLCYLQIYVPANTQVDSCTVVIPYIFMKQMVTDK